MNDVTVINELARPGIGHNLPPLADQLAEEIAADRDRAEELVTTAATAQIASDDDAGKVTVLIRLMRDHEKKLEAAHDDRKKPFLEAGKLVDAVYNTVIRQVCLARCGADGRGGLTALLTAYENRREAEARAERERLAVEQRQREEEAARARDAAEAAKTEGNGSVQAELAAITAEEEAQRLARQAQTLRPEPIRTALGSSTMRREIAFDVTDIRKLLGWMLKQPITKGPIEQSAKTIMGNYLRTLGVEAVERGTEIPGLSARIERRAQIR